MSWLGPAARLRTIPLFAEFAAVALRLTGTFGVKVVRGVLTGTLNSSFSFLITTEGTGTRGEEDEDEEDEDADEEDEAASVLVDAALLVDIMRCVCYR